MAQKINIDEIRKQIKPGSVWGSNTYPEFYGLKRVVIHNVDLLGIVYFTGATGKPGNHAAAQFLANFDRIGDSE